MNPLLAHLQPYPFERLRQLLAPITPNEALQPISLGIGEPKHPTPAFIQQAMVDAIVASPSGLAAYPATVGETRLREALFALTQTVVNAGSVRRPDAGPDQVPLVMCPNPFYQIYEGAALGRKDFRNLISFTSLSRRSNVPGMRSGFVAGDAALIRAFLLYRTYHGCAMSPVVQAASTAAWHDEQHVAENRALYRAKFAAVTPMLSEVLDVALPDAGFYLWAGVKGSDTDFARDLFGLYNVTVLPGSYLAREARGVNPGAHRVRMALVAETPECVEAARRIALFVKSRN